MQKTIVALDERELATILAALRYWQREMREGTPAEYGIATSGGTVEALGDLEIDALCERVNVSGDSTGMLAALLTAGGVIDALETQVQQMQGMFDDEDGTIQQALDDSDEAGPIIRQAINLATGKEG